MRRSKQPPQQRVGTKTGKHSENSGQYMKAEPREFDMQTLAVALADLRDALVLMSLALKDHLANQPNPARDEAMAKVERELARIRMGQRDHF